MQFNNRYHTTNAALQATVSENENRAKKASKDSWFQTVIQFSLQEINGSLYAKTPLSTTPRELHLLKVLAQEYRHKQV